MEFKLIRDNWDRQSIIEFDKYLSSIGNKESVPFEEKIVLSKHKIHGISAKILRQFAKEIIKGNFISFLNNMSGISYEFLIICGYVISLIRDFDLQIKYLNEYLKFASCWAETDIIKVKTKNNEEKLFNIAKNYISSGETFARRMGLVLLFGYVNNIIFVNRIFDILDSLLNEKEYYVNMAGAWLLAELFIKQRDITLNYFNDSKTNSFIINKAIQKCRDSYRVSATDKELLLSFKV